MSGRFLWLPLIKKGRVVLIGHIQWSFIVGIFQPQVRPSFFTGLTSLTHPTYTSYNCGELTHSKVSPQHYVPWTPCHCQNHLVRKPWGGSATSALAWIRVWHACQSGFWIFGSCHEKSPKLLQFVISCHIQIGKSQSWRKLQRCFASNGRACRWPSLEAKWRALQPSSSTWANLRFRGAIAFFFTNIMNQWPVVFTVFFWTYLSIIITDSISIIVRPRERQQVKSSAGPMTSLKTGNRKINGTTSNIFPWQSWNWWVFSHFPVGSFRFQQQKFRRSP